MKKRICYLQRVGFDVSVMLCRSSCYFKSHVACFSPVFMWSPVVRSKHPFRAMRCPVNVYFDRDLLFICDYDVPCIN